MNGGSQDTSCSILSPLKLSYVPVSGVRWSWFQVFVGHSWLVPIPALPGHGHSRPRGATGLPRSAGRMATPSAGDGIAQDTGDDTSPTKKFTQKGTARQFPQIFGGFLLSIRIKDATWDSVHVNVNFVFRTCMAPTQPEVGIIHQIQWWLTNSCQLMLQKVVPTTLNTAR